ncbi:MAG: hypothetical protein RMK64_00870 [Rhodovarius sp.]|nr:hypothetical protein [Rhodovarius sp.]MDW8313496.1 hypothetical protein [Rhodovarius sp.]
MPPLLRAAPLPVMLPPPLAAPLPVMPPPPQATPLQLPRAVLGRSAWTDRAKPARRNTSRIQALF